MSRDLSHIMQLKSSLEKAVTSDAMSEVLDILQAMNEISITPEQLRSTKIAISVNEVKKKSVDGEKVYSIAKDLLKKWKKIYELEKGEPAETNSTEKKSKSVKIDVATSEHQVIEEKKSESVKVVSTVPSRSGDDEDEELEIDHLPSARRTALDMFKQHMQLSTNEAVAFSLAFHIEKSIDGILPYQEDSKAYSAKVRSLAANLKRNEQLRADIVEGVLAPQNLVHLPPNQLATDEQRAIREKAERDDLDARRSDYYQLNRAKILEDNGLNPNGGGEFTCRRCKGNKTSHYALQTRSADEPMTVFVTCLTCGKRWKTN